MSRNEPWDAPFDANRAKLKSLKELLTLVMMDLDEAHVRLVHARERYYAEDNMTMRMEIERAMNLLVGINERLGAVKL